MTQAEQDLGHVDEDTQIRNQMERMVGSYDLYMKVATFGRERALRRETLDLAGLRPGESYLEVGCGTGTLTIAARQRVGASGYAAGIDIIPGMVARSQEKAARAGVNIDFRPGSIEAIPFPDRSFDVVAGSFMIFHMSDRVRRNGIREIRRVLRPGGRLLFLDMAEPGRPLSRWIVRVMFGWAFEHDLTELEPVLAESGFGAVESGRASFRILGMSVVGYVRGRVPDVRDGISECRL
jgi:ubiquinone/menaquinone biosynthesis C-methylase UbiE